MIPERHILITNLSAVLVNGVRTYTYALLLSELKGTTQIRGFGTDSTWPTFDLFVPSLDYTLTNPQGEIWNAPRPPGYPKFTGGIMQFVGGPRVDLWISNGSTSIRIDPAKANILDVWAVLPGLVRKFWIHSGIPTIQWGPR